MENLVTFVIWAAVVGLVMIGILLWVYHEKGDDRERDWGEDNGFTYEWTQKHNLSTASPRVEVDLEGWDEKSPDVGHIVTHMTLEEAAVHLDCDPEKAKAFKDAYNATD